MRMRAHVWARLAQECVGARAEPVDSEKINIQKKRQRDAHRAELPVAAAHWKSR